MQHTRSERNKQDRLVHMDPSVAGPAELESRYVHGVYASIAAHIGRQRTVQWPRVRSFLLSLPCGAVCADVGSGNGKYSRVNKDIFVINTDFVVDMLHSHKVQPKADSLQADNLYLPFRSNSLDACISVAVIHHLSTEQRRQRAVAELMRCVRPGGRVLVCVWAYEQASRQFAAQDVLVPLYLRNQHAGARAQFASHSLTAPKRRPPHTTTMEQRVIANSLGLVNVPTTGAGGFVQWIVSYATSLFSSWPTKPATAPNAMPLLKRLSAHVDSLMRARSVPCPNSHLHTLADSVWSSAYEQALHTLAGDELTYYRYYHVFRQHELDALVHTVPCARIVDSYYDHANWCVLIAKDDTLLHEHTRSTF